MIYQVRHFEDYLSLQLNEYNNFIRSFAQYSKFWEKSKLENDL